MKLTISRRTLGFASLILVVLVAIVLVGLRWGFTPLPKPPSNVRLEPSLPPLMGDTISPTNAAHYYSKAAQLVREYRQSEAFRAQLDALLAGDPDSKTDALEQALEDCRESLDLIRRGTALSFCQMPWRDPLEDDYSTAAAFRFLAKLLDCEGRLALRSGNSDRATDDFLALTEFGTDCGRGAPLLGMFVAQSIRSRGFAALRATVLDDKTSGSNVSNVVVQLRRLHVETQPMAETFRYELIASKQMFDSPKAGSNLRTSFVLNPRVTHGLCNAGLGDFIQEAEKPLWECQLEPLVEKWCPEKRTGLWMLNHPFATLLFQMMIPALGAVDKKVRAGEVKSQGTLLVCAVRAFTLAHGKPPETLDELVPEFLSSVPPDPLDGRPFRYRREGDGWVVWSVGKDKVDNGAEWHEEKYRDLQNPRKGGDLYFKSSEPKDDRDWRRNAEARRSAQKSQGTSRLVLC